MKGAPSEYLLAARTAVWLLRLPIFLRTRKIPELVEKSRRVQLGSSSGDGPDANRASEIVTRVCRMRLFDLPVFPRICLRRALALHHVLNRMGQPVKLHIGVRKDGRELHGHSWVTVDGRPVGEREPLESYRRIFTYPA